MKLFSLLTLALASSFFAGAAMAQDAALIAHPDVADTTISANDAKNILLGTKTKWDNGVAIKLVVLASGPVHEKVIKDHTQRTADQFDKHWKKQVFTGKGIMPQIAKSDAEVISYVSSNPGAFGYVAKESATPAVKVLTQ